MSGGERADTAESLADRVAVLEGELYVRRVFGSYPKLYGPMAVLCVAFSFLPLLEDVEQRQEGGTIRWTYGSLWEMAGRGSANPAVFGLLVVASLVVLLVVATVRVRTAALPTAIAVHAAVLVAMLLARPGTAEPVPGLTDAGRADLALLCLTCATAVTHAVHLRRWRAGLVRTPSVS